MYALFMRIVCCDVAQEGIQLRLDKYPQTLVVDLGVAAMGVESPEGALIRTGAGLHRLRSGCNLPGARPVVLACDSCAWRGALLWCWLGGSAPSRQPLIVWLRTCV